jgi:hypothetical protein
MVRTRGRLSRVRYSMFDSEPANDTFKLTTDLGLIDSYVPPSIEPLFPKPETV